MKRSVKIEPVKLIVNADDLGYSLEVNRAVFDLMNQGLVTSATLLANGPAVDDAVKSIPQFPNCSFGVHLNITEFRPLADWRGFDRCLDHDGTFERRKVERRLNLGMRNIVFREWTAQTDRLLSMGVRLSHFDSHQHIHTRPLLLPVLRNLQRKFGIRSIRNTKNVYSVSRPPQGRFLLMKKRLWTLALCRWCRTVTTDGFAELKTIIEASASAMRLPKTLEAMVHPGRTDFSVETELLRPGWSECIGQPVILINYRDL